MYSSWYANAKEGWLSCLGDYRFIVCTLFVHSSPRPSLLFPIEFWCGSPILSEIVPENLRTSIYALDRMLEMSIAAFAPPIVGILTEGFFGYVPVTANLAQVDSEIQAFEDSTNARALSRGLLATVAIPSTLCCFTYTFLYWTYPRDRDLASARMRKGETGHVKLHHVASSGDEEQEALALKFGSRDTVDVGEGCGAV